MFLYENDFENGDGCQQGEHPGEFLVCLALPVTAVRGGYFLERVGVGSQCGEEDGEPDAGIMEEERCMVAGNIGYTGHRFAGEVEVIVKPMGAEFAHLSAFQGATIMGDGRIVLVINPTGFV